MKKRIAALFATFGLWIVLFVLQKPVFLLMYAGGLTECLPVILHGLPLDLSVAGYITAVPALALTANLGAAWVSIRMKCRLHRKKPALCMPNTKI